jgi:hypothetical protein
MPALFQRRPTEVLAVKRDQVERAKDGNAIVLSIAQKALVTMVASTSASS